MLEFTLNVLASTVGPFTTTPSLYQVYFSPIPEILASNTWDSPGQMAMLLGPLMAKPALVPVDISMVLDRVLADPEQSP